MPLQQYLDRHRFLKGAYLMGRRYFDHHVGRDSAALTYYLLFALFPLLIFLSNLVGIMSVDISGFLHEIRAFIPQEALDIIEQYLIYVGRDSSPRLLWFSLVFSVYFPSRAAVSLMFSVRRAYGEHKPTQFVRHQLKLLLYTLSLILMIVLSIGLSVVGGRVLNFCSEHLSGYIALSDGFISLWSGLRFAILGGIVFFPTAMMYGLAQESPMSSTSPLANVSTLNADGTRRMREISCAAAFSADHGGGIQQRFDGAAQAAHAGRKFRRIAIMKIIIVGIGKVGYAIAEQMTGENHDLVVIDRDSAVLDHVDSMLDGDLPTRVSFASV